MRHVFRSVIPVDDRWHAIDLSGPVVHVATRGQDYVEIWHLDDPAVDLPVREFRVFGTGQTLTRDTGGHIGTAITPNDGQFVWHVFERRPA